jgi:hypothetical protein
MSGEQQQQFIQVLFDNNQKFKNEKGNNVNVSKPAFLTQEGINPFKKQNVQKKQ